MYNMFKNFIKSYPMQTETINDNPITNDDISLNLSANSNIGDSSV